MRLSWHRGALQNGGPSHQNMTNKNAGILVLAVWLILYGLVALLGLSFAGLGIVMGALAIVAGILLILGK
jgi:uncharacterized membrane protein HdeD (DUF308 family)